MPVILLIRHGENDYHQKGRLAGRLPGIHLNEKGLQQAQTLAERLADVPIKAIFSSPLERTVETAAPIARAKGLEVVTCAGLLEIDYGAWQDQPLKNSRRRKLWRLVQQAPSQVRFPGGESFLEAQERICQAIDALCTGWDPKDVLVCVSHADPIKLAVARFLGLPLDHFQRLAVNTASTTVLALGEDGCRLLALNLGLSFEPFAA